MDQLPDTMAWMRKGDGNLAVGYGPFIAMATPPADGVAFYVQDFALTDPLPWKVPAQVETLSPEVFAQRFTSQPPLEAEWKILEAGPFSEVFQEIMAAIRGGVFEKTVPVVTETARCSAPPAAAIVQAMARQKSPLHCYGWLTPHGGFAGATPELLFSQRGRHLETMALAGTARAEDSQVFAVDEKEIREHEYVAQTLVSKLLDLGNLTRNPRKTLNLGSIVHFLSLISVELKTDHSPESLLRRLHPTPALGPLPRTNGTLGMLLDWRARLGCPPGFGAPFGLWDCGLFTAIVAIRGIWWQGHQISLPAGCGIIEASRLVNEWRELRLKREAVKGFLKSEYPYYPYKTAGI